MGASFTLRMNEDTGAPDAEVAKAFTVAREIFDAREFWVSVEGLDNKVDAALQSQAILAMWNLLRQATRWLLNQSRKIGDIQKMIERLAPGVRVLSTELETSLSDDERIQLEAAKQPFIDGGFPEALANRIAMLPRLFPALDVVETAAQRPHLGRTGGRNLLRPG